MVWYGMVYVNLYGAIVTKVSNALGMLVPRKQASLQALFEGAKVLLCAEVVGQRVPNQSYRSTGYESLNSTVLSSRRKAIKEGMSLT